MNYGFTFLMYPILGLIPDMRITRYRIIKLSVCLALISYLIQFAEAIVLIFKPQLIISEVIIYSIDNNNWNFRLRNV